MLDLKKRINHPSVQFCSIIKGMSHQPLAHRMRPYDLSEYVGQEHLLGKDGPIRQLIFSQKPANLILWGPPGVGKTSLAHVINQAWNTEWMGINATLSSIQDIKRVIETAKNDRYYGKQTVLFIDEIHRFSKTQQDALLSVVEDGTLTLMGATTENPKYAVIPGLVSRCLVYECKPLSQADLSLILDRTWSQLLPDHPLEDLLEKRLLAFCAGDARKLCNAIELFANAPQPITVERFEKILPQAGLALDETTHYDVISAVIKSLRGSDPNAALYWIARLLESGEDPVFIARRMVIFAAEDIGNADPQALILATAGMQGIQNIGMPESRIILSQLATYLATAPKSNASYTAINAAIAKVKAGDYQPVPEYLKSNAESGYKYPHDYPYAKVTQKYWDESEHFYQPKDIGFEREINKRLKWFNAE
jgi:putative ATPase